MYFNNPCLPSQAAAPREKLDILIKADLPQPTASAAGARAPTRLTKTHITTARPDKRRMESEGKLALCKANGQYKGTKGKHKA